MAATKMMLVYLWSVYEILVYVRTAMCEEYRGVYVIGCPQFLVKWSAWKASQIFVFSKKIDAFAILLNLCGRRG